MFKINDLRNEASSNVKESGAVQRRAVGDLLRDRRLVIVSALFTLLLVVSRVLNFADLMGEKPLHEPIDLEVYRAGAAAFLRGENLYTQDYMVGGITLPFTYPPLAALLFAPLELVPVGLSAALCVLGSAALLWWCIVIVVRQVAPTRSKASHRLIGLVLLPVALTLEPILQTLWFAQINVLLMALVLVDTLTRRRWLPQGVLIGLAAAIKLTPAVFGLYFLAKKDYRAAVVTTVSGIGFTALAWLISPANSAQYWFDTLRDPARIGGLAYAGNQSIRGVLARLATEGGGQSLWLPLALLTIALIAVAMRRVLLAGSPIGAVVLNSMVALLCSPVAWTHHWVWWVPALILLGATAWRGATARGGLRMPEGTAAVAGAIALSAVVTTLIAPHWLLPHAQFAELRWPVILWPLGNAYVLLGLVLVLAALARPTLFGGSSAAPLVETSGHTGRRLIPRVAGVLSVALVVLYVADYTTEHVRFGALGGFQRLRESAAVLHSATPLFKEPLTVGGVPTWPPVSPIGAALLTPLLWLTSSVGILLVLGVSLLALSLVVRAVTARATGRSLTWASLAVLMPLVLVFRPVRDSLTEGDLLLVLLPLVVIDVFGRTTWWPRGLLVGVAGAVAGWPLLAAFAFAVRRDRSALLTSLATGIASIAASLVLLPADTRGYLRWWLRLPAVAMGEFPAPDGGGNATAFAVLARQGATAPWTAWLLAAVLFAVIAVAAGRLATRNPLLAQSLIVAAPPLVVPVAAPTMWVGMLPLILLLAYAAVRTRRAAPAALAWIGVLVFVISWLPDEVRHIAGGIGDHPWPPVLEVYAAAPVLVLLVTAVWCAVRPRDFEGLTAAYTPGSWRDSAARLRTAGHRVARGARALWA